jgi:hypothetical protein
LLSTATAIDIGKCKKALTTWAECLQDKYSIIPIFAHTNKDMGEIGMLQDVWSAKIQLCWWHLWKAVRERLKKNKLSTMPYNEQCAHLEFTFIDPSFIPPRKADSEEYEGGIPDSVFVAEGCAWPSPNAIHFCIPTSIHHNPTDPTPSLSTSMQLHTTVTSALESIPSNPGKGEKLKIQVPPKAQHASSCAKGGSNENGLEKPISISPAINKREFFPKEHQDPVVDLMESHLCVHPLIPGYSHPSPEGICEWAVKQMYQFCVGNDLQELWAYLWENWYRPGWWELWA